MLRLYHTRVGRGQRPANLAEESLPKNVAWIDLIKPEPDEVAFVKRTTGLDVPSIEDLSEIESSSQLRSRNGAIYLSAPLVYRADSASLSDLSLPLPEAARASAGGGRGSHTSLS